MYKLSKKDKIVYAILSLLLFATISFIWLMSVKDVKASTQQSSTIKDVIQGVCDAFLGKDTVVVSHNFVRKLAHFSEFFGLGVILCALFWYSRAFKVKNFFEIIFIGAFIALVDESLQALTDRSPSILDVLLDTSGVLLAILMFVLVLFIIKKIKEKKVKKAE